MGLSDSLSGRSRGYVFPPHVARFRWLSCRASQAPRLICPRALSPTTPEGPLAACACCFTTGLSGFILVGGLATFVFLSRPIEFTCVTARGFASPVAGPITETHARSATC